MKTASGHVSLWLGGARSGKSRLAQARAEALAETLDGELVFLATGEARDPEMAARIARHRADRGPRWRTVETPTELPEAIEREDAARRIILVDCLTLWLSNLMFAEADLGRRTQNLLNSLQGRRGSLLVVSNEVGAGIVPENELARRFRDEAGRLNQVVAQASDEVFLVAAGLTLRMK